jgi:hypothetical protein
MNLFTGQDKDFSKRVKKSDWSPTPPVVEQFRKDFEEGSTTKAIENHKHWKITSRRPTSVSRSNKPSIDNAEIIEITYRGDKNFEKRVISNILPSEYK